MEKLTYFVKVCYSIFKDLRQVNLNIKNIPSSEKEMKVIYELFYKRVFRAAYFIIKDVHLAQDIVQETFIKALSQLDSLQEPEKMGAWLSTIAKRTAIDYMRKENRREEIEKDETLTVKLQVEVAFSVENVVEANLIVEEIINKVLALKIEFREVLLLRYILELSQKEIAELTKLNIGTVKSRLHRGGKALKEELMKDNNFVSAFL